MANNDDIKQFLKKFPNDDTKKGSLMMILQKIQKGCLIMVPKQFKKFRNDDDKNFKKVL